MSRINDKKVDILNMTQSTSVSISDSKKEGSVVYSGFDVGTMFCQCAKVTENGKTNISSSRNSFVEIDNSGSDLEEILLRNKWQYINDSGRYYVIGDDSLQVVKLFPNKLELRRPMQDGVLNKNEEKKNIVLGKIIESMIGQAPKQNCVVATCVSSQCIDDSLNSDFHALRLKSMFTRLGWNVKVIEEGLAVILNERPSCNDSNGVEIPYSGIGISFGGGRVNCVLAYKGLQIIGMSVSRSGDWIDKQVSGQTGAPISQILRKKETELDFNKINEDDDIIFGLSTYYDVMLKHVFNLFSKKFMEIKTEFDMPLDIVVAGGTSMPNGFETRVEKIVRSMDLPFKVSLIKKSKDPRNSVVMGLLTQAAISQRKLDKGVSGDSI